MRKFLIGFLVLTALVYQYKTYAQTEAGEILTSLQNKFDTIEDLSAVITQSINGKINLTGRVYFKKENKIKFEFRDIFVVSDGKTNWNYNKKENKVIISDYEEDAGFLSINSLVFDYPEECELSSYIVDDGVVLRLIPNTSTLSFNSIKLWINNENLISRALIDDPAAGLVQLDISDYKLNSNLPDSYFIFIPPEGSKIIDLR